MGRRTILMLVAILVAALGSTLVFLYVQGINDRAIADQEPVEVLTAKDDIAAGESIDDALAAGKLELTEVPKVNILPGALTTTEGLKGQLALTPIFAGEQIVPAKFGATAQPADADHPQGRTSRSRCEFNDPDRVAGFVQPGSKVAIFVCVKRRDQTEGRRKTLADVHLPGHPAAARRRRGDRCRDHDAAVDHDDRRDRRARRPRRSRRRSSPWL